MSILSGVPVCRGVSVAILTLTFNLMFLLLFVALQYSIAIGSLGCAKPRRCSVHNTYTAITLYTLYSNNSTGTVVSRTMSSVRY